MSPEARHRAWGLFGRLVTEGLTDHTLPIVQALPAFADVLEVGTDPDRWAAEHHRVWSREVFPFASVFLGDDGLLGGPIAAAVGAVYQGAGFFPALESTEADHLGLELAFLAHLAHAERPQAHAAMLDHLLGWLPPVVVALERAEAPFEARVATLALELAVAERAVFDGPSDVPLPHEPVATELPDLDNPDTRLKHIIGFLSRPASGWWLSQRAMDRLAGNADLPAGFDRRERRLESLFFGAVDHRRLAAFRDALDAEAVVWQDAYTQLPGPTDPWSRRLASTRGILGALQPIEQQPPTDR